MNLICSVTYVPKRTNFWDIHRFCPITAWIRSLLTYNMYGAVGTILTFFHLRECVKQGGTSLYEAKNANLCDLFTTEYLRSNEYRLFW